MRTVAYEGDDFRQVQTHSGSRAASSLLPDLLPEGGHVSVLVLLRHKRQRQRGRGVRCKCVGRTAHQLAQQKPRQLARLFIACVRVTVSWSRRLC